MRRSASRLKSHRQHQPDVRRGDARPMSAYIVWAKLAENAYSNMGWKAALVPWGLQLGLQWGSNGGNGGYNFCDLLEFLVFNFFFGFMEF